MDYLDGLKIQLAKLPQQKLATLLSYLLLTISCYYAALLTWTLFPIEPSQEKKWTPALSRSSNTAPLIDISAIQSLALFGKKTQVQTAQQAEVIETIDAPKTRLNLKLSGVVASSEPSLALAIIEVKGKQATYVIDEQIGNSRSKLKKVLTDRVLIEYQGKLETLMLDGEEFSKAAKVQSKAASRDTATSKDNISKLHADLLSNPASITDYVRISPVRKKNQLVGYRVNPGKKPALFNEVGLKSNDLAVSLNGIDLTDKSQALGAMKELKNATEISLTVERDEQLHTVYLSLP